MRFSKTELKLLEQAALGRSCVLDIARALKKDKSQIYRTIKSLKKKGFAELKNKKIIPSEKTHVQLLLQELSQHSSIIKHLSGCGIIFYTCILEPKTIPEIISATGMKRSTVFYKIKLAQKNSFIRHAANKYELNYRIWPKIKEFLNELEKYEETNDKRVPPGSVIYYKNKDEILFSTKVKCDSALTGFSAYGRFGIKIYNVDYTYYLPKKSLTKKEVFLHSLYRAEKDGDARDYIIISLFYIKHRKFLSEIKHEIINNLNKVLKGQNIERYPRLSEIKERADVYDIRL